MTEPGAPSPQEELRTAIVDRICSVYGDSIGWDGTDRLETAVDFMLVLFATRVVAIEAERDEAKRYAREHMETAAWHAEQRRIAEADLTAAQERLRLCNIDQINVEAELSQEVHVDMLVAANNEQHDLAVFHSQRAEKAEADLAAMTAEAEKWRIKSAVLDAVFAERDQLRADLTAAQERIRETEAELAELRAKS